MPLILISFLSGVLTVLAPCVLPLLPVVLGASTTRLWAVVGALGVSVFTFTLLLKATTLFISVPPVVWTGLSSLLLFFFGLTMLYPAFWHRVPGIGALFTLSSARAVHGAARGTLLGDMLLGASLGPVFASCSPTYFIILATIVPASFVLGMVYIAVYIAGLMLALLLVVRGSSALLTTTGTLVAKETFTRVLGWLCIIVAVLIFTRYDKIIAARVLDLGLFDVTRIEQRLLETRGAPVPPSPQKNVRTGANTEPSPEVTESPQAPYAGLYEVTNPSGFINSDGFTLRKFAGKPVLVFFFTYSCINCQRATPYVVALDAKYKKEGLVTLGIHTPEFSFEKNRDNVTRELRGLGITFPVAMDNDYATWNAFDNVYWPARYLLDGEGRIVYSHFGEGDYGGTDAAVAKLLTQIHMSTKTQSNQKSMSTTDTLPTSAKAYMAGGCFWCTESDFEKLPGVTSVVSGYANGTTQKPTYEDYGTGGHIEAVEITYNPRIVSYAELAAHLIDHVDALDGGGQFADRGHEYIPALFYQNRDEERIAKERIAAVQPAYTDAVGVTALPLTYFYPAEDYHQDYHTKNPLRYGFYRRASGRDARVAAVCKMRADYNKKMSGGARVPECGDSVSAPEESLRENSLAERSEENRGLFQEELSSRASWKSFTKPTLGGLRTRLTNEQYRVTQEEGTEASFSNPLNEEKRMGIYVDVVSGEPLYSSKDKYDSGTGWPSFVQPIEAGAVREKTDYWLVLPRTEVRSSIADSHLGHVFNDGPSDRGGKRYCMNGAALRFIPKEEMMKEGYGDYIRYVE